MLQKPHLTNFQAVELKGSTLLYQNPPMDMILSQIHLPSSLTTYEDHLKSLGTHLIAASFRRIVEQAVLTSLSLRTQNSLFMVSLHHLQRLDG
jgi:hypothetical protein